MMQASTSSKYGFAYTMNNEGGRAALSHHLGNHKRMLQRTKPLIDASPPKTLVNRPSALKKKASLRKTNPDPSNSKYIQETLIPKMSPTSASATEYRNAFRSARDHIVDTEVEDLKSKNLKRPRSVPSAFKRKALIDNANYYLKPNGNQYRIEYGSELEPDMQSNSFINEISMETTKTLNSIISAEASASQETISETVNPNLLSVPKIHFNSIVSNSPAIDLTDDDATVFEDFIAFLCKYDDKDIKKILKTALQSATERKLLQNFGGSSDRSSMGMNQ